MADYADMATIAADSVWQSRCSSALVTEAVNVMGEDPIKTANHGIRVNYARQIIGGNLPAPSTLALLVFTNPAIAQVATIASLPGLGGTVGDDAITTAVADLFNALAGIGS